MKTLITFFLLITSSIFCYSQTEVAKLLEGTVIRVKSLTDISSKTANEGDMLDFICLEDVLVKGKVVIREGARVSANVEDAEQAKGLGKQGSLKINFNYVRAIDDQKIPLRAVRGTVEGKNTVGTTVALAVVLSPLFLFKKGKNIKFPAGKIMEAYVGQDIEISVK